MHRKSITPYLLTIAIAIALIGLTIGNFYLSEKVHVRDEFAGRWMAAGLWLNEGLSPYSDEVTVQAQSILEKRGYDTRFVNDVRFIEPAYNLMLYLPLSFLSFNTARAIWLTLIELAIGASIFFSIKLIGWKLRPVEMILLIVFSLLWYPGLKSILFGSPTPINIFIIILAIYLLLNKQDTPAGFLLASVFISIEISLLLTIYLIVWSLSQKRLSVLWSFLAGLAFLGVISLILFPGWFAEWFRVFLIVNPGFSWINTPLMRIAKALPGIETLLLYVLHIGVFLYMLYEWFTVLDKTGKPFVWKTLLTLLLIYLFNTRSQAAYLAILLPALFLIFRFWSQRWRIFGKIAMWVVILSFGIGYWFVFFEKGGWFLPDPSVIILLLPLVVFIGLNWIRWWALSQPDLLYK